MAAEGCEVTVHATSFQTPGACVRCGALGQIEVSTSHHNSGSRTTRTATLPYCNDCDKRRRAVLGKRRVTTLSAIGIGLVAAGTGVALPALPFGFLVGFPIAAAVAAGLVLRILAGAAVETPNGGWMTGFSSVSTTFFFTNPRWGQAFAVANGASVLPRRRSDSFWILPSFFAALFASPLAAYVAYATNPPVYVDNESGKEEQIWVDGRPVLVAPTMKGNGERPSVRVPYGAHALGFSVVGASRPSASTAVRVAWSGEHVYNPGRTACYWLEAAAYGTASTSGMADGPQAVQEFYSFKHVDNWFSENPPSVSTKSSGETRVSLTSIGSCADLASMGCPVAAREAFAACATKAYASSDDDAYKPCAAAAVRACRPEPRLEGEEAQE